MVRKIRAKLILQLRADGLSGRAIAASQGMSRKSITAVLDAAEAAGTLRLRDLAARLAGCPSAPAPAGGEDWLF